MSIMPTPHPPEAFTNVRKSACAGKKVELSVHVEQDIGASVKIMSLHMFSKVCPDYTSPYWSPRWS